MEADAGPERRPAERRDPGSAPCPDPEEGARARAEFCALHGPALRASGVPERYWGRLLHKLEHEVPGAAGRARLWEGGGIQRGPWKATGKLGCGSLRRAAPARVPAALRAPGWTAPDPSPGKGVVCGWPLAEDRGWPLGRHVLMRMGGCLGGWPCAEVEKARSKAGEACAQVARSQ